MFCTKCGHENADDAGVCTQCGASVVSEESIGEITNSEVPMTKKEFFMSKCSTSTKQKRKAVKILSTVSLTIQGVLAVLLVVGFGALVYAIEQNPLFEGSASGAFGSLIAFAVIFTGGAFVFTILGIKKNSTGFFVAATIFSFLSAAFGSMNFGSLALRQLIAFGTLAIYIAVVVLNYQSNKEYKQYVLEQKGGTTL